MEALITDEMIERALAYLHSVMRPEWSLQWEGQDESRAILFVINRVNLSKDQVHIAFGERLETEFNLLFPKRNDDNTWAVIFERDGKQICYYTGGIEMGSAP